MRGSTGPVMSISSTTGARFGAAAAACGAAILQTGRARTPASATIATASRLITPSSAECTATDAAFSGEERQPSSGWCEKGLQPPALDVDIEDGGVGMAGGNDTREG